MSKTYCYQWSQSAIQIWCRSSRESILSLKNPKDTAEGCSMTPLLPLNSYYTDRTHKCSIYKILLQDLYFLREFFEVHRELTIHYNNANVTNRLLIFFSHRKINTKSTAFPYTVHCGTCTSTKHSVIGNQNSLFLRFSAVVREIQHLSFCN